jgi:NADPH:quinone reductase
MAGELPGLVLTDKIASEPSRVLPLEEAAVAHRLLEARKATGATVRAP